MIDRTSDDAGFRILVIQQVRDALHHLDAVRETPDGWQCDLLANAIAHLSIGNFSLAQEAAFHACHRLQYQTKAAEIAHKDAPTVTVAELLAELDRVVVDSGS